jgi:hypothetical protein
MRPSKEGYLEDNNSMRMNLLSGGVWGREQGNIDKKI